MLAPTDKPQRRGLLFREKPFLLAYMFPRLSAEVMRELVYRELLHEDELHREAFEIEELGH